jgi:hypothetical protein
VSAGDFNDDTVIDLLVANQGSSSLSLLPGLGDGTFGPAVNIGLGAAPSDLATGDLNGDGFPDAVVTNGAGSTISVLLGSELGLSPPVNYPVGTAPAALRLADFTGDGVLDVATANQGSNNVTVLPGQGNGTFGAGTTVAAGVAPSSLAAGDLDGDGDVDLFVGNQGSSDATSLINQGGGAFIAAETVQLGGPVTAVGLADLNGDTRPDALASVDGEGTGSLNVVFNGAPLLVQPVFQLGNGVGTIVDLVPVVATRIDDVVRYGYQGQPTFITLSFTQSLDPVTAGRARNYRIVATGPDGVFGTRDDRRIPVRSVIVGASRRTVTLRVRNSLPMHQVYRITVDGRNGGVLDFFGFPVGASLVRPAGGPLVTTLTVRDLAGPASALYTLSQTTRRPAGRRD